MRRSGARKFDFDIDSGVGSLLPPAGKPVDFDAIRAGVKTSGFELLWIEARVRGTLRSTSDPSGGSQPSVEVESPRQAFALIAGPTDEERRGYRRLRASAAGRELEVRVHGRVHAQSSAATALTVLDFEIEP